MRIGALLLFLLASGVALATVNKGMRAPAFTLPALAGGQVSLASERGKVVVIDFWAQWCEPCKKELPQLDKLNKDYASRGAVVLAINIDKTKENAERMAQQLGLTLPVLLDPTGAVAGTYDLPKMPTSFVVDKKGIVRNVHAGFDGASDITALRDEIDGLLK